MAEGLREVAQELVCMRIDFFCIEVDVVREIDERVHCLVRLVEPSRAGECLDEAAGAGDESAIDLLLAAVAVGQRAAGIELGTNGIDRARDFSTLWIE